jgi:DMSO/TMAO reductase YedYZ molybdopterin-dependent catalytic subunit
MINLDDDYRLSIDGAVRNPLTLSYKELREMPSETRTATLECAGNGRVFLVPQVRGAQWELGAVGNAEWTGVPLRALLERAGLEDDACEVVLEGADRGTPTEEPTPPGAISYARSVPREKAVQPEVLIAYQMNGSDLSRQHGYPARAIVPGHYGMASVKWLTCIQAVREPFQGYWQTSDYGYWDFLDGKPVRRALAEMKLKSAIARPRVYETLRPNQTYTVFGAAWAGETEVTEIAVSTDRGQTWAEAHLREHRCTSLSEFSMILAWFLDLSRSLPATKQSSGRTFRPVAPCRRLETSLGLAGSRSVLPPACQER